MKICHLQLRGKTVHEKFGKSLMTEQLSFYC